MKVVILTVTKWQKPVAESIEKTRLLDRRLIVQGEHFRLGLSWRVAGRQEHPVLYRMPAKPPGVILQYLTGVGGQEELPLYLA